MYFLRPFKLTVFDLMIRSSSIQYDYISLEISASRPSLAAGYQPTACNRSDIVTGRTWAVLLSLCELIVNTGTAWALSHRQISEDCFNNES
jgi:hypothetical protein